MMPVLGNAAGLWALLGLPAIIAIHFLQQRSRVVRTSTWFLIEKLAPDSARGRSWDRLRSSRTLWLQLLAVLLLTWVIIEPRWVKSESAQTVVVVLDASSSMAAFRPAAMAAGRREMDAADGLAARTTWVVMTTNPRQPALYRGLDRQAANATLAQWQPELGEHDFGPALRIARALAGVAGRTLLITDTRAKVSPDQRAVGVGHPLENVGFAGASVVPTEAGVVWRALVKNHGSTPQRRTWQLVAGGVRSADQEIELAPGALTELSALWPASAGEVIVALSADGFEADDRLPLVRPVPKPLSIAVEGDDAAAEFFRKAARGVDGVSVVGGGVVTGDVPASGATLRAARLDQIAVAAEPRGGIYWPPADRRRQVSLLSEPVVAERHPWVDGLNWQAWIGSGPDGFPLLPGDVPLLWQGRYPLVFMRPAAPVTNSAPARGRKLMLAFDWGSSNAGRLPSMVLLAERFLAAERDAQRAPYTANFDAGAHVPLAEAMPSGELQLKVEPVAGETTAFSRSVTTAERAELRAPARVGFFTVSRGGEIFVRGAAQFADPRQGDFRHAASFTQEIPAERTAAVERNTRPDPFAPAWLGLLVAVLLGTWWTRRIPAEKRTAAMAVTPS